MLAGIGYIVGRQLQADSRHITLQLQCHIETRQVAARESYQLVQAVQYIYSYRQIVDIQLRINGYSTIQAQVVARGGSSGVLRRLVQVVQQTYSQVQQRVEIGGSQGQQPRGSYASRYRQQPIQQLAYTLGLYTRQVQPVYSSYSRSQVQGYVRGYSSVYYRGQPGGCYAGRYRCGLYIGRISIARAVYTRGRQPGGYYAGQYRLQPIYQAVRILGRYSLYIGHSYIARAAYTTGGGRLEGTMLASIGSSLYTSRLVHQVVAARGSGLGVTIPAGVGSGLCTKQSIYQVGIAYTQAYIYIARYIATCVASVVYIQGGSGLEGAMPASVRSSLYVNSQVQLCIQLRQRYLRGRQPRGYYTSQHRQQPIYQIVHILGVAYALGSHVGSRVAVARTLRSQVYSHIYSQANAIQVSGNLEGGSLGVLYQPAQVVAYILGSLYARQAQPVHWVARYIVTYIARLPPSR